MQMVLTSNEHEELCTGRPTPSVACVVQPGVTGGFQKVFFGREEIAIPLSSRCARLLVSMQCDQWPSHFHERLCCLGVLSGSVQGPRLQQAGCHVLIRSCPCARQSPAQAGVLLMWAG